QPISFPPGRRYPRRKWARMPLREEMGMDETGPSRDETDRAFWSWLGFWLQLLILGVLAVVGAFFASRGRRPGDYACGMLLILGVIALAFLWLKHNLDGGRAGWGDFLLVDDTGNL